MEMCPPVQRRQGVAVGELPTRSAEERHQQDQCASVSSPSFPISVFSSSSFSLSSSTALVALMLMKWWAGWQCEVSVLCQYHQKQIEWERTVTEMPQTKEK